jgi:nucleotide-binding universal stress UspA family protein
MSTVPSREDRVKVILATDGTKFADAAAEILGKLTLGDGDSVKIISVVDLAMPMAIDIYGGYLPDTSELEKVARENAEKVVGAAKTRVATLLVGKKVDVSVEVLFGSPDSRIVETAEDDGADLIVIGSHGYKQWERLLLGSVSDSVVHHAHCSVLIVR